jgi:hypothetical protein
LGPGCLKNFKSLQASSTDEHRLWLGKKNQSPNRFIDGTRMGTDKHGLKKGMFLIRIYFLVQSA